MSKFVKELMTKEISQRLDGVSDLLVVDVAGLDANSTVAVRRSFRSRNINLLVVKKTLARRACEGTSLGPAFSDIEGSAAIVWGGEDIVDLAKEIVKLHEDKKMPKFTAKGGVMDGEALSAEKLVEVSKWPNRAEQLSLLVGQILGPGRTLGAQIKGPGAKLASQIKKLGEGDDE
ncbi:50S ribosomal protein L10 [Blastopirellula sp. J2-11]|uniref:50S ribosomal protein L10 n=1 Tax=Blastopirellula sp. J2-11 TaxID=2943192 RepID=UPI0021C83441|nr:50S ribosomal protein L10 [Blastopirellula sp. J2-11]UUO06012.1 50S ribosomal protein L10 [Blastopirellula sp. J2-11]